eukprot:472671-Rhodomonas_salina.1
MSAVCPAVPASATLVAASTRLENPLSVLTSIQVSLAVTMPRPPSPKSLGVDHVTRRNSPPSAPEFSPVAFGALGAPMAIIVLADTALSPSAGIEEMIVIALLTHGSRVSKPRIA